MNRLALLILALSALTSIDASAARLWCPGGEVVAFNAPNLTVSRSAHMLSVTVDVGPAPRTLRAVSDAPWAPLGVLIPAEVLDGEAGCTVVIGAADWSLPSEGPIDADLTPAEAQSVPPQSPSATVLSDDPATAPVPSDYWNPTYGESIFSSSADADRIVITDTSAGFWQREALGYLKLTEIKGE